MVRSERNRGPMKFARIAARLFDPVTAKRGFAKVDLIASWDDIVGPRYAGVTQPAKLQWRRDRNAGAVLTVRVGGPSAVFLQHEKDQFLARINAFLGYEAVAELRIIQQPIQRKRSTERALAELPPEAKKEIDQQLAGIESDQLKDALDRLGTVLALERLSRP